MIWFLSFVGSVFALLLWCLTSGKRALPSVHAEMAPGDTFTAKGEVRVGDVVSVAGVSLALEGEACERDKPIVTALLASSERARLRVSTPLIPEQEEGEPKRTRGVLLSPVTWGEVTTNFLTASVREVERGGKVL